MVINSQPLGVTINAYGGSIFPTARANDIKNLGLGWLRNILSWSNIETGFDPNTGISTYNWDKPDDAIAQMNALGVNYDFVITGPPSWWATVQCSNQKFFFSVQGALSFANAILARYNGATIPNPYAPGTFLHIESIEFGNEGFDDNSNENCRTPQYLAPILQAVYPVIKAALPTCLVGAAAHLEPHLSHIQQWQENLYAFGGGPYCDYTNFHYYRTAFAPNDNGGVADNATFDSYHQTMHQVDVANGYPNKEIWCTEIGWPTGQVSEQQQSDYLEYCLNSARQSGYITHLFFYTLEGSNGFSLVSGSNPNSESFKVAYYTVQSYTLHNPVWDQVLLPLLDSIAQGISDYITNYTTSSSPPGVGARVISTGYDGTNANQTMGRLLQLSDPFDLQQMLLAGTSTTTLLSALFAGVLSPSGFYSCYFPLLDQAETQESGLSGYLAGNNFEVHTYTAAAFNYYTTLADQLGYQNQFNLPQLITPWNYFPYAAVDPMFTFTCGTGTDIRSTVLGSTTAAFGGGSAFLYIYKTSSGNAIGGAQFTLSYLDPDGNTQQVLFTTSNTMLGSASLAIGSVPLSVQATAMIGVSGTGMTSGETYTIGMKLLRTISY